MLVIIGAKSYRKLVGRIERLELMTATRKDLDDAIANLGVNVSVAVTTALASVVAKLEAATANPASTEDFSAEIASLNSLPGTIKTTFDATLSPTTPPATVMVTKSDTIGSTIPVTGDVKDPGAPV